MIVDQILIPVEYFHSKQESFHYPQFIEKWLTSEKGAWVKAHSLTQIKISTESHHIMYRYVLKISADLSEEDQTYFLLKWGFRQ